MSDSVKVALAQLDLAVGDVAGNTARIIEFAERARDQQGADLVVFPELSICGYPPEDLLFHAGLRHSVENAVAEIRDKVFGIAMLIGFPEYDDEHIYNSCAVFEDGHAICHYRKQILPNYSVFDEERYFTAGKHATVFKINGIRIGLTICEDVWRPDPIAASRSAGAECVIAINGSPYELGTQAKREQTVRSRVEEVGVPIVYLNMVGGQDELVFDGGSFVMDTEGEVRFRAPPFEEGLHTIVLHGSNRGVVPEAGDCVEALSTEGSVYRALV
ncbi:MAG: NAD+ synthase, partial [Gammaproteobacteria bacterium]|nr:NAD+ synthase [Gammaproteobacteria bacterium]